MQDLTQTADLMGVLGDPSRVRLLAVLDGEELSVAELVLVTGLAQSRVSTHLAKLREAGLLRVRRQGSSALYAMAKTAPAAVAQLWRLVRGDLNDAIVAEDAKRRDELVNARGHRFPESVAGEMERHYSPGRTWEAFAYGLSALLALGDVLDVGCGDGAVAALLAPVSRRYVGLDRSERMIAAAKARLVGLAQAEFVVADMHDMPFSGGTFDRVALYNVLTYATSPERVLSEAGRVLRPGGSLVVQTLNHHAHLDAAAGYGHIHPGFHESVLRERIEEAGLSVSRCDIACRERKAPHFEVMLAVATKPGDKRSRGSRRKSEHTT
jgi:SAM-dependent methyltransferase